MKHDTYDIWVVYWVSRRGQEEAICVTPEAAGEKAERVRALGGKNVAVMEYQFVREIQLLPA